MFTGLVEKTGEVIAFTPTEGAARLTIAAPGIVDRLHLGDSVAVCGVCLTALTIEPGAFPPRFSADLAAETIARTTLSRLGSRFAGEPGAAHRGRLAAGRACSPGACGWDRNAALD